MGITIKAGQAYVTATPSSQNSQVLRVRASSDYTAYTINANASGSTKYDWIYLSISAVNANTPSSDGSNVASIVTSRSSSNTTDNGTPPTYGLLLAIVTVANGASSITNSNITDKRFNTSIGAQNGSLIVTQSGTGVDAKVQAAGTDANVNLDLRTKGTGVLEVNGTQIGASAFKNPYKFWAYQNSAQTLSVTSTDTKVSLQATVFDTGSNFSTSTFLFTAPITGFYFFSWAVTIVLTTNSIVDTLLYVNGAATNGIAGTAAGQSTGGNQTKAFTGAGMLQLTASDTVGLYMNAGNTGALNAFRSQTYLQGFLISSL